jgi:hypothetical protein
VCGTLFVFLDRLVNGEKDVVVELKKVEFLIEKFLPKFCCLLAIWLEKYEAISNDLTDAEVEDKLNLVSVNPDAAILSMRPTFYFALDSFAQAVP